MWTLAADNKGFGAKRASRVGSISATVGLGGAKESTLSVLVFSVGVLCILGGESLVLLSDLVELSHVLEEVRRSLEGDEQFGLFTVSVTSWPLHCDGSGSDLFEGGVIVPTECSVTTQLLTSPGSLTQSHWSRQRSRARAAQWSRESRSTFCREKRRSLDSF